MVESSFNNEAVLVVCMQLLLLGTVGQWVVKPVLGILLASTLVPALKLPSEVATGLILVSPHTFKL